MSDFEQDLRAHLVGEADRVQAVPRALAARISDVVNPRSASWLRFAPVAVALLSVGALGLAFLRQERPASPPGGTAAVVSSSPEAPPSASPSALPASSPNPPPDLGPFVCGAGGSGGSQGATGNLKAVRLAHRQGFDRITFEFAGSGIPQYAITRQVGTRFSQDASGMNVDVQGNNAMKVVFHGASERDASGNQTYPASNDLLLPPAPGAANAVAEVRQVGDFERVLSWAVGLSARPACSRVLELSSPSRLVVDVQLQP